MFLLEGIVGVHQQPANSRTLGSESRFPVNGAARVPLSWWRWLGTIFIMVAGALAAYYSTVYGIRLTVNEKADRITVEAIEYRLVEIETLLRTSIAHRSDLMDLRSLVDNRLTRIEAMLQYGGVPGGGTHDTRRTAAEPGGQ